MKRSSYQLGSAFHNKSKYMNNHHIILYQYNNNQ